MAFVKEDRVSQRVSRKPAKLDLREGPQCAWPEHLCSDWRWCYKNTIQETATIAPILTGMGSMHSCILSALASNLISGGMS